MKTTKAKLMRALFCLFVLMICGTVMAQDRYVVTATRLNVRKDASAESAVVGGLSKGDQVDVYSFKGGWAEIGFKEGKAFVAKKYIEKVILSEPEAHIQEENETQPEIVTNETKSSANVTNDDNPNDSRVAAALVFAFGGHNVFKHSQTSSFTMVMECEGGKFISTSSAFYTFGLGLFISSAYSKNAYYTYDASNWGFRIPAHIGYLLGNDKKFHASVRAGVYTNFIVGNKVNKEHVDISFGDRFSWNGGIRFTVGYKEYCLMAEYEFPFQSGGKGVWMFGFLGGF